MTAEDKEKWLKKYPAGDISCCTLIPIPKYLKYDRYPSDEEFIAGRMEKYYINVPIECAYDKDGIGRKCVVSPLDGKRYYHRFKDKGINR